MLMIHDPHSLTSYDNKKTAGFYSDGLL